MLALAVLDVARYWRRLRVLSVERRLLEAGRLRGSIEAVDREILALWWGLSPGERPLFGVPLRRRSRELTG